MSWFEVDKGGLRQLHEGKDKTFVIRELIQNPWDEPDVTRVTATIEPVPGRPLVKITVTDDAPEGFYELKHAYTLYADTRKRGDPEKRGRFNLGEKQVLSIAKTARITSTTGVVDFLEGGKRSVRKTEVTEKGSIIEVLVRMTREEIAECESAALMFMPPPHIKTVINGTEIPARIPIENVIGVKLTTEHSNGDGVMKRTQRKTTIEVHEPLEGEKPMLYEMGLPVVELEAGDPWHINICQRVPLNSDRDNVSPAFLRDVRAEVLNLMANRLTDDQSSDAWVSEAAEDERIDPEAVTTVVKNRFGKNAVVADPSDPQSRERAIMAGYTIVPARAMSKDMWSKVREAGAVPSSSKVFGTTVFESQYLDEDEITENMAIVEEMAKRISKAALNLPGLQVKFYRSEANVNAQWTSGTVPATIEFNMTSLGESWFHPSNIDQHVSLIIHEVGHNGGGHLDASYIATLCNIGARLFKLDRRAMLADITNNA